MLRRRIHTGHQISAAEVHLWTFRSLTISHAYFHDIHFWIFLLHEFSIRESRAMNSSTYKYHPDWSYLSPQSLHLILVTSFFFRGTLKQITNILSYLCSKNMKTHLHNHNMNITHNKMSIYSLFNLPQFSQLFLFWFICLTWDQNKSHT